jgi:4-amino-4-deoxy-L-arabinose transferase-like glycosyltransferase
MDSRIQKLIKIKTFLLVAILAIGIFFRLFLITKSPPSLNWDEAALGYNAYSLLKTGKDEYGHPFPLVLRSFDDYKPALYSYLTIPFIATFGLSEFSVRAVSVLSGILIIILIYLIAKEFFNEKVALFSAFLVSIEPWAVHFSRAAFEANLALMLSLTGIYFALKASKTKNYLYLSVFFLTLSSYAYHANRALLIPLIVFVFFINRKYLKTKIEFLKPLMFTLLLILPLIYILSSGNGLQRLESTSILRAINLNENLPEVTYSLVNNLVGRYMAYFSPAHLFVRGTNEPNQRIFGFAVFHILEFFFFIWGAFSYAKNNFKPKSLLYLIIISPLPAVITWNWFLPARTLLLFSMFSILTGYGSLQLIAYVKKINKVAYLGLLLGLGLLFLNSIGNLATSILLYMPYMERGNWQYGFKQIMAKVAPIADNYEHVVFETGHAQPHIFVLFYSKYSPARYHQDIVCPDCVEMPRKNFDFGKYVFRKIYWPDDRNMENTLFVGSEFSLPEKDIKTNEGAQILFDITDERGEFIARVVEKK